MKSWLPRGHEISSGVTVRNILSGTDHWEIYETSAKGFALLVCEALFKKWINDVLIESALFRPLSIAGNNYYLFTSKPSYLIASMQHGPYPKDSATGRAFAQTMKRMRGITAVSFHDALYLEQVSLLLPTYTLGSTQDDRTVLGTWLSGGVHISTDSFRRLCSLLNWMPPAEIAQIAIDAGIPIQDQPATFRFTSKERSPEATTRDPKELPPFSLPGRTALEAFFNDHIVDIIRDEERYHRLGIDFPGAIILHGPPGCGKTYAVERLIEFLGWPSYSINSGSVGSPFIHDTSKKVSEMFDAAMQNAPAVLVIDEMEAFLSERSSAGVSGAHRIEEIAEFLRKIPEATKNHVLVIAMTNMIDAIDSAILRRGRFDHILAVDMPSKEEVAASLTALLSKLPVADNADIPALSAILQGHPMSDVAFVVKEAGRIAAKAGKDYIDNTSLNTALQCFPESKAPKRTIGFSVQDTQKD